MPRVSPRWSAAALSSPTDPVTSLELPLGVLQQVVQVDQFNMVGDVVQGLEGDPPELQRVNCLLLGGRGALLQLAPPRRPHRVSHLPVVKPWGTLRGDRIQLGVDAVALFAAHTMARRREHRSRGPGVS